MDKPKNSYLRSVSKKKADTNGLANYGSESAENLIDELVDGDIDDDLAIFDALKLGTVIADETAKNWFC